MTSSSLQRRLGLGDAVFIGLGSMIGAGVFAVWAPAADAAGTGLLIGLAIAAIVAFGNATSSAQLAAAHPTSGGTYAYGRAELGPWWGFIAGWGFVVGKIASCAAMALTFAAYAAPAGWERPVAIVAVVVLTAVNGFGVTRTAGAARVIVVVSLGALAAAVTAAFSASAAPGWLTAETLWEGGGYGILQSAGLLFFAFAGYARIATMGEEVRDPRRVIPRAIVIAFLISLAVYASCRRRGAERAGPGRRRRVDRAGGRRAPRARDGAWIGAVVRVGAAAASLGALLALIAGVSRTAFAMSREGDLPRFLDRVHPRWARSAARGDGRGAGRGGARRARRPARRDRLLVVRRAPVLLRRERRRLASAGRRAALPDVAADRRRDRMPRPRGRRCPGSPWWAA